MGSGETSDLDVGSAVENRKERESMSEYQIDWNKLAKYNLVVNTTPRNPLEDVVKNDELVSWMKEYPDAMNILNKIKDKK